MLDIVAELQALISEINAEIVQPPDADGADGEEKAYRKGVNMGKRQSVTRLQLLLKRVKSDIARY